MTINTEVSAQAGDVWMEADGVLLLCTVPGESWQDFTGQRVEWNAPLITRPLTRLIDPRGKPVGLAEAWDLGEVAGLNNVEVSIDGEFIHNPYRTIGDEA